MEATKDIYVLTKYGNKYHSASEQTKRCAGRGVMVMKKDAKETRSDEAALINSSKRSNHFLISDFIFDYLDSISPEVIMINLILHMITAISNLYRLFTDLIRCLQQ